MTMRAFRLYGQSELRALQTRMDVILQDWLTQSCGGGLRFETSVHAAADWVPESQARFHWVRAALAEQELWYAFSTSFARHFAQQGGWTGHSKASSPLWEATLADAIHALAAQILKYNDLDVHLLDVSEIAPATQASEWDPAWADQASGMVLFKAAIGTEALYLILTSRIVEKLIGSTSNVGRSVPLSDRRNGIAKGRLAIEVVAGRTEVSVSELVQLSAGNVLVLDTSVGSPLSIRRAEDGLALGVGYLAAQAGRKVIQIAGNSK